MPKYGIPTWAKGGFLRFALMERGLSEGATTCTYEGQTIPGLLQTPEYALQVSNSYQGGIAPEIAQAWVDFRMARQQSMLAGHRQCHFILDEAAMARQVGGPTVMAAQLTHLAKVAELANVTIRIIPFTAGSYPSVGHSYVIFWLTPARAYLYQEDGMNARRDRFCRLPSQYGSLFLEQSESALSLGDSLAYLRQAASALTHAHQSVRTAPNGTSRSVGGVVI